MNRTWAAQNVVFVPVAYNAIAFARSIATMAGQSNRTSSNGQRPRTGSADMANAETEQTSGLTMTASRTCFVFVAWSQTRTSMRVLMKLCKQEWK